MLARIGTPTGDGRILAPGGGSSRDLPLAISWQERSGEGHSDSVTVARMETIRFQDGMVTATGTMLESAPYKVIEDLEAGIIGPSVDLDDIEYVMNEDDLLVLTRWRVAGATLVTIPAFADVSFTLDPLPAPDMDDTPVEVSSPGYWSAERLAELASFSMQASAAPPINRPPLAWFQKPDLDRLTPLTVSDTGRVFGHIAPWGSCHVGLPGCVTPPSSPSGYSYFMQGDQPLDDGSTMPVGTLTVGGGHADAQLAWRPAQEHYDNVGAAVAKVSAGEDEFGIWVAGWILPQTTPEQLDAFRASPVSGDWRRIGGALEMIAVCSVNSAGFPVPRARVAFSNGHQRTLVGSFGITPVAGSYEDAVRDAASFVMTRNGAQARWAWAQTTQRGR